MTVALGRAAMPTRKRVFVCVQNRPVGDPRGSCQARSGGLVYHAFHEEMERQRPGHKLTSCGCLGPCETGASVLVYPEGILYGRVAPEDVAEIVTRHLIAGQPVMRLIVQGAEE
jgi:(2Fe-2S) ferredoxin